MKRFCLIFLALALTLCAPAVAEETAAITLTQAGTFSSYADFEDDCANIIDTNDEYLEGVFDVQGNVLVPCEYVSLSDYGVCSYYTVQNEDGVNKMGAVNAAGEMVMPMEYGNIDFLSEKWGLGVKLEVTDTEPYDYQALFGDENYIVTAYDVYDLATGALAGTLSREQLNSVEAYGDYLYVEDRSGVISVYDAALSKVGEVDSLYEAYASTDEGVVSLSTGEVVVPGYRFYADLGHGLLAVSNDEYMVGVADLEGNLVADCVYDSVYEYDILGYARVSHEDKYGLIDLEGNLVVPCEYDGIERVNYGGDYVYALNGYACVEVADRYGYVALNGEVTCEPTYVSDTVIGLSMIVPDITGQLCIVAADGVVTPTDYAEFAPYPGGDGMMLKAKNSEEMWGLIDWHGNVILDFEYDYSSAILIAPDGSAVLVDTDDGMVAYTVSRG